MAARKPLVVKDGIIEQLQAADTLDAAHSIASHNDTTATGAELETLTDNSIANTLHRHSELVASDGAPDPALAVDADGNVTIGETLGVTGDISGTLNGLHALYSILSSSYLVSTCFDSYDSCGSFISGSGSLVDSFGMSTVRTGVTNNSASRRNISNNGWYFTRGVAVAKVSGYPSGNTTAFIGMSQLLITNLQSSVYNVKHAAFIYNDGVWYASVANGAAQSGTDITADVAVGRWEIDGRTSGHVKFRINGVEVADITTNLPTESTGYGFYHWYVNNKLTGTSYIIYMAGLGYVQSF